MKRSIFMALFVSVAVHVILAVGLIACLEYAPEPKVVATLDLTSVELSFAEKVEESAAVTPVPPSPPPEPAKPKSVGKPPEPKVEKREAPDPLAPRFPEPKEEKPEIKTPEPHTPNVTPRTSNPEPQTPSPESQTAAQAAPRQARVDAPPSPKRTIRPDYPKGARQRGEQGEVVLEIRVDADGAVTEAKVVVSSGYAELDGAAVRAAERAKFRPAKSGDRSVASTARLRLAFRLK